IMLTTLSLNILSNWARTVADPQQRWRLQTLRKAAR
ncbi:MAG: ABC transporter permease, partial [Mesorhizobium sp.]